MFQIWFLIDKFLLWISEVSELESSLISFAESDSTLAPSSKFHNGYPYWVTYREAIILNISIRGGGGRLFKEGD